MVHSFLWYVCKYQDFCGVHSNKENQGGRERANIELLCETEKKLQRKRQRLPNPQSRFKYRPKCDRSQQKQIRCISCMYKIASSSRQEIGFTVGCVYVSPASTASERNAESGFVNKELGASNSATYEWINNSALAIKAMAYLALV